MAWCLWLSLLKTVIIISQGKVAAHGCQMGWECTMLEQPVLQEALESWPHHHRVVACLRHVASWCPLAATGGRHETPSAKTGWDLCLLNMLGEKIYQHVMGYFNKLKSYCFWNITEQTNWFKFPCHNFMKVNLKSTKGRIRITISSSHL